MISVGIIPNGRADSPIGAAVRDDHSTYQEEDL